jgi:hypothetical protein
MVVIVAVAIYGAALGLSMRPGMRAVIVAAASVGAAQYAAIWLSQAFMHSPGGEAVAMVVAAYAGSQPRDLAPTAFAAALAAVIGGISQSGERRRRARRIER